MNTHDKTYHALLLHVLQRGVRKADRTGTGTQSVFGYQARFNLMRDGFPLVSTKKVHFKSIVHELLWFLKGETNTAYLLANGVTIWEEWADENGDLGPVYGAQWRSWPGPSARIDQLAEVIEGLKTNPDGRRHLVSAWNVSELGDMALPPCHVLFQFYSREMTAWERAEYAYGKNPMVETGRDQGREHLIHQKMDEVGVPRRALSVQLYQRSADLFLGVPFNIASYALLLEMVAHVTGHVAEELVWTGGDVHIYDNHRDQVLEQLRRTSPGPSPLVTITRKVDSIDDFRYGDIQLLGYNPLPGIKAPVAV